MRGIFDGAVYDEFDPDDVGSERVGYLYEGKPNYFEYDDFDDGGSQRPLEIADREFKRTELLLKRGIASDSEFDAASQDRPRVVRDGVLEGASGS